jgi:hypothetical protein
VRRSIAASIPCHAAIKINTCLDHAKMEWLLRAVATTDCPMSCPNGPDRAAVFHAGDFEGVSPDLNSTHAPRSKRSRRPHLNWRHAHETRLRIPSGMAGTARVPWDPDSGIHRVKD